MSSSSAGDASSIVSADTDADSAGFVKEEAVSLTAPADVQIARLEAEAARQKELRAAKSKQNARRQASQVLLSNFYCYEISSVTRPSHILTKVVIL